MALIVSKNGKKYYSSYKKKLGRKKKHGPKRKLKKRGRSWQETWDYKIVKCNNRKQNRIIAMFHNIEEVTQCIKQLEKENKEVIFPVKTITDKRNSGGFIPFKCEYVILERVKETTSAEIPQLRNEFGKLVDQISTNEKWRIYDKVDCFIEETFSVYGYNQRTDRKTFQWILDNLLLHFLELDRFLIIRVSVYYNKVLFRYDAEDLNIITCKNIAEAIRFYNLLQEYAKKERRIVFTGRIINKSENGKEIINMIQKKTGWKLNKINRISTMS